MARDVLDLIASETYGKSYKAHKLELELETDSISRIDSREPSVDNPKQGETVKHKGYVPLKDLSVMVAQNNSQILTYFLDGSRHVYKIDDIAYQHSTSQKIVYPIVAGQVTVGCCRRFQKKMTSEKFLGEIVLALPDTANASDSNGFLPALKDKINDRLQKKKFKAELSKILLYSTSNAKDKEQEFENRAIAAIQDYMYQTEQLMVANLVSQGKLSQDNYLIKDGSLEYRVLPALINDNKKFLTFKGNYGYVVGLSKKFNPSLWKTGVGSNPKSNPAFIAELPLYHRTPVICFENRFENENYHGSIKIAVWYLRIRSKHTDSPFDGVVKVEKMLVTQKELDDEKIDSDLVDLLSAYIINERNPVCYGSDNRWANHIYPIFLTESFVKSRCISAETFLNLF
mgnify:CR=1 FL=1